MTRTLDRYVLRGFLYSYLLCFVILMGMRIISDLFINMDEFAEADLPWTEMVKYVGGYYLYNSLVYFRELGGVILAAAAAFNLARMNHTNELTAILASGVSLYRVLRTIVILGVLLAGLSVVNQEVLIPGAKDKLVRSHDDVPGTEAFPVDLIADGNRNVWASRKFSLADQTMTNPLVIARDSELKEAAKFAGFIAAYDRPGAWRINGAIVSLAGRGSMSSGVIRTRLTPTMVAQGRRTSRDGHLRIVVDDRNIDLRSDTLGEVTFEILDTGDVVTGAKSRVLARICAAAAHYGPVSRTPDDKGYFLVGRPELRADQIRSWAALCRQLVRHSRWTNVNRPGKRIMAALPTDLRKGVDQVAAGKLPDLPRPARKSLLKALNEAIDTRGFYLPEDFPAGRLHPADAALLARRRADLTNEQYRRLNRVSLDLHLGESLVASEGELWIPTDLTPEELCLRQNAKWLQFMSTSELNRLLRTGKAPDPTEARVIKHSRFTQPLVDLTLLLVGIPFILSRERNIKASASRCVGMVTLCYLSVFVARYLGAYGLSPILAAWLPILVFVPIAIALLDAVKT